MPLSSVSKITLNVLSFPREDQRMLDEFLNRLEPLRQDLNQDIEAYNNTTDVSLQRERLLAIEEKMKSIHDAQSDRYLAVCPDYFEQFNVKLFKEIQQEKHALNLLKPPVTLPQIIEQMDPEKVNALTEILANNTDNTLLQTRVERLYKLGEKGHAAYDAFWVSHRIRVLGGGNSKNFEIHNTRTLEHQVLKIENRLGNPKQPERALEASNNATLSSALTAVYVERQTAYVDQNPKYNQRVSRTLLVTEFCAGSDVETYCAKLPNPDVQLIQAVSISLRMAKILEAMQTEQRAFPDMKNTNWLIDEASQIRLADRKTFIDTDANGDIAPDAHILKTEYVTAPEMLKIPAVTCSAEAMHVYSLGKNLYQSLAKCSYKGFYQTDQADSLILDASGLNFTASIFQTTQGAQLKQLIQATVQEDPNKRLSLRELQIQLKKIDPKYQQATSRSAVILLKQCSEHVNAIQKFRITTNLMDTHMSDFVSEYHKYLQQNPSLHDLLSVEAYLAQTLKTLKAISPKIEACEDKIKDLKKDGFLILAAQLDNILRALPVEERHLMFKQGTPEAADFNNVLAKIQAHDARIEAQQELIDAIEELSFGSQDQTMQRFIQPYRDKLNHAPTHATPESSEAFTQELESILQGIKNQSENICRNLKIYRDDGFGEYADKIEAYLAKIPIEQRAVLKLDEHLEVQELMDKITEEQAERDLKKQLIEENKILLHDMQNGWGSRISGSPVLSLKGMFDSTLTRMDEAKTSGELASIQSELKTALGSLVEQKKIILDIEHLDGNAIIRVAINTIKHLQTPNEIPRVHPHLELALKNLRQHIERVAALPPELSTLVESIQDARSMEELEAAYESGKLAASNLDLLKHIKTYEINMYDIKDNRMATFIATTMGKLNQAETSEQLANIHKNLESTLTALEKAKPIIDDIVASISEKKLRMDAKAKRVVSAMVCVPLDERKNIPTGKGPMAKMVLEAMASSRMLPEALNFQTRFSNPATMFKDFKARHIEQQTAEKNKTNKKNDKNSDPAPDPDDKENMSPK